MRADCLPRASVSLVVDHDRLVEHPAEPEDPFNATSYVEIVTGAEFSVVLNLEPGFAYTKHSLGWDIYLDGQLATGLTLKLDDAANGLENKIDECGYTKNGVYTFRKFCFAEHTTTDDTPTASDKDKFSKLGEVKVVLVRCRKTGSKPSKARVHPFTMAAGENIPEKALKGRAISNHIKLGQLQTRPSRKQQIGMRSTYDYPWGKTPIATYTFKYRSHYDLQAEGIIARSPSPAPLEGRDPDTLTAEEARELVRRMRVRENAVKVKQELIMPEPKQDPKQERNSNGKRERPITLNGNDDDEDITITSFLTPKRARAERLANMEVIDLT